MDKQKLIDAICVQLERDLEALSAAAMASREAAVGEESKPENEYDTRGLEASYLAGAQAKRAQEIAEQIAFYKSLNPKKFSARDAIAALALVKVERAGKQSYVFLVPKGGGISLSVQGKPVQAIAVGAPLGEALIGLRTGDEAAIETPRGSHVYEILGLS